MERGRKKNENIPPRPRSPTKSPNRKQPISSSIKKQVNAENKMQRPRSPTMSPRQKKSYLNSLLINDQEPKLESLQSSFDNLNCNMETPSQFSSPDMQNFSSDRNSSSNFKIQFNSDFEDEGDKNSISQEIQTQHKKIDNISSFDKNSSFCSEQSKRSQYSHNHMSLQFYDYYMQEKAYFKKILENQGYSSQTIQGNHKTFFKNQSIIHKTANKLQNN